MVVELEKSDLIKLVMSETPEALDRIHFTDNYLGAWSFYHSTWEWNVNELYKMSEESLLDLYSYLRGKIYVFLKE